MTGTWRADAAGAARERDARTAGALVIGQWLCLAATPTFALMAVATGVLGGGPMETLCSAGHGSALSGMVPMYVLMSAFHSAPWLKLISRGRSAQARNSFPQPEGRQS
jgi:hypothetical protein